MPGRIFINYRRGDEPGFAGRLYDRLEGAFEPQQLFMDVDSIPAGHDFVRVLEDEVDKCDVLLAVIGQKWSDAADASGLRRLDNPNDFVRIEIESGLKLGKRVIPVLVNDAKMPAAEDLPDSLKPLARRNAIRLTHDRFRADSQGLLKVLEVALEEAERARDAKTEADRLAVEAAARRKIDEEEARAAQAEQERHERSRQQASAGLGPEEVRKAEELANWDFIKSINNEDELRNHLARFPGGVTERYAKATLEQLVWAEMGQAPSVERLQNYVAEFPSGINIQPALAQLNAHEASAIAKLAREDEHRRQTEAWAQAALLDTTKAYDVFLNDWPRSDHKKAAISRKRALSKATVSWRWKPIVVFTTGVVLIAGYVQISWPPTQRFVEKRGQTSLSVLEMNNTNSFETCMSVCVEDYRCRAFKATTGQCTLFAADQFSITSVGKEELWVRNPLYLGTPDQTDDRSDGSKSERSRRGR